MPDFNSAPTRFDDDFNMGFNGRKLYDKRMVTSQGRSVWPEKLTAGVPIETMGVEDRMLALEYTVCPAVELQARRRMDFGLSTPMF